MSNSQTPAVISGYSGTYFAAAGDVYRVLVDGHQTGGHFTLAEILVQPGGGPPPHIHRRESETFYVLEGTVDFMLDGKLTRAAEGSCVFAPMGIPHRFTNSTDKLARFLVAASPAGLEEFFKEIATPLPHRNTPPPPVDGAVIGKVMAAAPRFGIEILPPG